MLFLKQLKAKACRGIVDGPELNFESDGLFLVGDNGTGKSSYVDAIEKVLTGRCSSLDTGDQGLSWDNQGKHISSKSPPEIQMVITDGNKDFPVELDTPITALDKPLQALLSAAHEQSFILRRRTLLAFINAKPAHRYEAIEEFLRLEKFNTFETKLRALFTSAEASLLAARAVKEVNEAALRRQLQLTPLGALDEAACLKQVNGILEKAVAAPIAKLDEAANRATEVDALLAPFSKMNELQKVQGLKLLVQEIPSATRVDLSGKVYSKLRQETIDEETKLKGHFYEEVLKSGLKWIQEDSLDSCPLCENEIKIAEVTKRVEARLAEHEGLSKLRGRQSAAHAEFVGAMAALRSELVKVQGKWQEGLGLAFPEAAGAVISRLNEVGMAHKKLETPEAIQRDMAELQSADIDSSVAALLTTVETKLQTYPSNERYQLLTNAKAALQAVIVNWKKVITANAETVRLNTAQGQITIISKLAEQGRKIAVQGLLDRIAAKADEYFQIIHPGENIGGLSLKVPDRGTGSIALTSKFHGKQGDPRGCYSEGHVDSVGLCIFLAIRRLHHSQKPELAILVLDDVLHSVDGEHRLATAKLILKEFDDHQIIITTHDPLWFENLKAVGQGRKFRHLRIANWSLATGPVWGDHLSDCEWLKSAVGLAAKPADRIIKAGRLLEEMLQNLCDSLSVAVPFRLRGDYTLDPLWTSFLPKAKKNASFYAAAQVHLEKIDELRRLRNLAGAHYNQWAALLTGNESKELSDAIVALRECAYCPDCNQFVKRIPELDGVWSCKGEHLRFKANP